MRKRHQDSVVVKLVQVDLSPDETDGVPLPTILAVENSYELRRSFPSFKTEVKTEPLHWFQKTKFPTSHGRPMQLTDAVGSHPCWSLDVDGIITLLSRVFALDNWDEKFFPLECATLNSPSLSLSLSLSLSSWCQWTWPPYLTQCEPISNTG